MGSNQRTDLEHAERDANSLKRYGDVNGFEDLADFAALTLAMVAELRPARRVIEVVRPWPPLVCVDCYEAGCDGDDVDEPCGCEDGCHAKDQVFRDALDAYDQATGQPDPAAGHESGDTSASQLPPPPAGVRQDLDERERRKATAEFLRAERERYEYLLACAKDAEDEELAWEPIVARVTVGDFIRAAKEVLAFRAAAGHAEPEGPSFDPPTIRRIVDELHAARELIHDVGLGHLLADGVAARGQF